jgi:hypothetical protein
MERKIMFEYERDTKNKYRFRETADEPLMGTVYVSKELFDERPGTLEVTLRSMD